MGGTIFNFCFGKYYYLWYQAMSMFNIYDLTWAGGKKKRLLLSYSKNNLLLKAGVLFSHEKCTF